jgi:hypothetical protein
MKRWNGSKFAQYRATVMTETGNSRVFIPIILSDGNGRR